MTEFTCPVCDDEFGTAGAIRDHAWDAHGVCHYCGEELTATDELYIHWLATHDDDLSRVDRKQAESEVGELSFGNRLAHQGPVGAVTNTSISRRKLLASGALAVAGAGGVAANSLLGSSTGSRPASGGTSSGTTAAPATFTTINGEEKHLADYRGQKVMFWVFATWCPSCKKAARALQANNDKLQDLTIIALKTHGNAGYDGPSVSEFAQQYASQLLDADNWIWGNLSKESTQVWNPQNRPDIYWLIDKNGTIVAKTAAPAATMNRIVQFAQAENPDGDRPGKSIPIQPAKHIQPGASHPDYNSNPPTSGWHYPKQADWGVLHQSAAR
jgi:thiol-disulfide isomerase/thioredoxin